MDNKLVYALTPVGDEAVRQSTRVVKRTLRMVLVQVDGKLSIAELATKIGNQQVVEKALQELEEGGFIAPTIEAASIWEESTRVARNEPPVSALSQFSSFGPRSVGAMTKTGADTQGHNFSSFGKPILPTARGASSSNASPPVRADVRELPEQESSVRPRSVRPLLWGLLLLPVLVLLLAIFFPYDRFRPGIERTMGELLGAPVSVAQVTLSLWPQPRLNLSDIRLGGGDETRIERVVISSPWSLLGAGVSNLSRITVEGARLSVAQVSNLPLFEVPVRRAPLLSFRQLRLERLNIAVSGLIVQDLSGDIYFRDDRSVEKSLFENVDRSIRFEALPSMSGLKISAEGFSWKPFGTSLIFDALQAKGLLQKNTLTIDELDTTLLGGRMTGRWQLDWTQGLSMTGEAKLAGLDVAKVCAIFAPAFSMDGSLAGALQIRGRGLDSATLWANTETNLMAMVTRGIYRGVDFGEAVRRTGVQTNRAGSTKFDRLSAEINVGSGRFQARNIFLDAGAMSANGQVLASGEQGVDAGFVVSMQSSVSTARASVRLTGQLPDLVVTSGRP